jgi:hypothetical protein
MARTASLSAASPDTMLRSGSGEARRKRQSARLKTRFRIDSIGAGSGTDTMTPSSISTDIVVDGIARLYQIRTCW